MGDSSVTFLLKCLDKRMIYYMDITTFDSFVMGILGTTDHKEAEKIILSIASCLVAVYFTKKTQ